MTNYRRLAAWLLAVLVLFAVAASLFVVAQEADHNCMGEDCAVCAVIALCRNTLQALFGVLIAAAALFACLRFTAPVLLPICASFYRETPVILKVKLLN